MKKIGLGIAILLFAIIISLCSSGMGLLVIGIGIAFGFCGYIMAYGHHIIWLEGLILMPVLAIAIEKLNYDKKVVPYTLLLAFIIIVNFYYAVYVCLFAVFYFLLLNRESFKEFLRCAVDYCADNNRYIAAICAAPSIIGHKGLLDGRYATCFPGYEKDLKGAIHSARLVAVDGKFITAKGAGCSMKFALKLVELLVSKEKAEALESGMQSK